MPDPLFSAKAKIQRANEHLEAINVSLRSFSDSNPYRFVIERQGQTSRFDVICKIVREPPLMQWSLEVSECLQAFRATLDHAVYALAIAHSGQDPPPSAEVLAFPIRDDLARYKSSLRLLGELRHDSSIRAAIEGLQPYNRPHGRNDLPPLALLEEFNRADKHRELSVAVTMPGRARIGVEWGDGGGGGMTGTRTIEPIKNDACVMIIELSRVPPNVKVKFDGQFIPALFHAGNPTGSTASGINIVLEDIRDEVAYCLSVLEALFP